MGGGGGTQAGNGEEKSPMGGWTCTEDVHTQDGPKDTDLCSSDSHLPPPSVGTLEGTWNYLSHPPRTSSRTSGLGLGLGKGAELRRSRLQPGSSSSSALPPSHFHSLLERWCSSGSWGTFHSAGAGPSAEAPPLPAGAAAPSATWLGCGAAWSGGAVGGNEAESSGPQRQALNHRPLAQAALSIPRMINCSLSAGRKRAR